jgi:hypothetical protein
MSDLAMPALDDVDLPAQGCWVAFRSGRDVYVLRGDQGLSWTVLSVRGTALGAFRCVRQKYRPVDGPAVGKADADWREVVRALC